MLIICALFNCNKCILYNTFSLIFSFQIITTLAVLATAKPIDIDEDHPDVGAITEIAPNGLHFGDRINEPTTPRDAASAYSLSYIENTFPEKPEQDDDDEPSGEKSKRSLDSEVNKVFFDSIYQGYTRNVRKAQGASTIELGDLVSAVESTLVHSAQNLAIANATNTTSFNSTETSTVIALPITLPTPSTTAAPDAVQEIRTTVIFIDTHTDSTTTETPRKHRSVESEVVNPIVGSLSLLSGITFSSAHVDAENKLQERIDATTEHSSEEATTVETVTDDATVTIIQTINSTQVLPTDTAIHVQQQQITLFSAGAGIFPAIPAIQIQDYSLGKSVEVVTTENSKSVEIITKTDSSSSESDSSSSSSSSDESHEKLKTLSKGCSDTSDEGAEDKDVKCEIKLVKPSESSTTTNKLSTSTVTTTTTETVEIKLKKAEILKEKIAEVEADPVILTQGI